MLTESIIIIIIIIIIIKKIRNAYKIVVAKSQGKVTRVLTGAEGCDILRNGDT
jgi:hypothetical protein